MGLKPLSKADGGAVDESEHIQSPDSDRLDGGGGGGGGDKRDTQDSPELLMRGKFAFTGEGDDEVGLILITESRVSLWVLFRVMLCGHYLKYFFLGIILSCAFDTLLVGI